MAEVASLRVPPSAVCTAHTVYAFIVGSNGLPHPDTTASVAFRVTGCATGSSSPTPMPSASSPPPTAGSAGSSDDSGLGTAGVVGIISAALLATVAGFYLARRFLAKRHRQGVDAA
jgi:hypothetical protein